MLTETEIKLKTKRLERLGRKVKWKRDKNGEWKPNDWNRYVSLDNKWRRLNEKRGLHAD